MTIGLLDHPASNLAPVHGTWKDEFATVRDVFTDNPNTTRDIGASVAVFVDGECVVDLWGGYYDMTFAREWERHTIVQMFSNTKTLTALSALVLADREVIDLHAPVAKYWPEFAQNGKGDIEVRQFLNYSSGVAGWTEHMTLPEIYDVEKSTAMLGRQAPWWKPGTAHGYHGFTIGHLVGEVVLRATGKSLGQFLANGGAFGKRLMSEQGRLRVLEQQVLGTDLVFGFPINWGLGYSLDGAFLSGETGSRQAWWGGAGGSIAFVDLDARMSFSYVPNKWITGGYEQERGRRLLQAAYAALKVATR
jgi:CubicO group peptidase (beta-lactamase class C family)